MDVNLAILLSLTGLSALCADRIVFGQDAVNSRSINVPSGKMLGWYTVLPGSGVRYPPTTKERQRELTDGGEPDRPEGGELKGRVNYPDGRDLAVLMADDNHGTASEKLEILGTMNLENLYGLWITTPVNIQCLKRISQLKQLRFVHLTVIEQADGEEGCACFKRLTQLESLTLYLESSCRFGSTAFCDMLQSLEHLNYISIPCENLGDSDVEILASHPAIERISLRAQKARLGSRSLTALRNMKRLRELMIVCSDTITDADVMPFADLPRLEMLNIVTNARLTCRERIKQRRPDCFFVFEEPSEMAQ